MNNSGKEKKKSKPGAIIAGLIVLVSFLSEMLEDGDEGMIGFIILLAVTVFIIWTVAKAAKKGTKRGAEDRYGEHSHDRLTVSAKEIQDCDGMEHWKTQLDGFMRAGLIERDEYNVLLNRYKQELQNKN